MSSKFKLVIRIFWTKLTNYRQKCLVGQQAKMPKRPNIQEPEGKIQKGHTSNSEKYVDNDDD